MSEHQALDFSIFQTANKALINEHPTANPVAQQMLSMHQPQSTQSAFTGGTKAFIREVVFTEVPGFQDQVFRPFVANHQAGALTGSIIDTVREQSRGMDSKFSAENLVPLSSQMLEVSAQDNGIVGIMNGWQRKRFSFSIKVDLHFASGGLTTFLLRGFTDSDSIHSNGLQSFVAEDTALIINSVAQLANRTTPGSGMIQVLQASDDVLQSKQYASAPVAYGQNQYARYMSQRPMDLANAIESGYASTVDTAFSPGGQVTGDTRSSLYTPVLSSQMNNVSANYAAKFINGYTTTHMSDTGEDGFFSKLGETLIERTLAQNAFIRLMSNLSQSATSSVSMQWRDLKMLDPTIDQVTRVANLSQRETLLPSSGLMTGQMQRSDLVGQLAQTISSSLSGLMNGFQLGVFHGSFSNFSGLPIGKAWAAVCYNPNAAPDYANRFIESLSNLILVPRLHNMGLSYTIDIFSAVWSETFIKINITGYHQEDFLFPSFSSSLNAPTVTPNAQGFKTMATTLNAVCEIVKDAIPPTSKPGTTLALSDDMSPMNVSTGTFNRNISNYYE